MTGRRALARKALARALRVRRQAGIGLAVPLCPFDLAEQLGVEVRFVDIPSLEGMYVGAGRRLILVPADRPPGRQRYGCAHELGHHLFGHGTRAETVVLENVSTRRFDPEECLAECFAGFLLMPKGAVVHAFTARDWAIDRCTPVQVYVVACWLGVSYEGLLTHLEHALHLISAAHAAALQRRTPRAIRKDLLGASIAEALVVVDENWTGRTIDLQVGDLVDLPQDTLADAPLLERAADVPGRTLFRAVRPGTGRLLRPAVGWSCFVRVMRRGYVGRSIFRHLEDPDYEPERPHP